MQKKIISLTDPQFEYLKAESYVLGISVADLIRRIVDYYRHEKRNVEEKEPLPQRRPKQGA